MVTYEAEWVLVGTLGDPVRVIGPFADADDARELANRIGVAGHVAWDLVRLQRP